MEASKSTLLAGQYNFLLVGGWVCATVFVQLCLCAILCQSVSRPPEVVVTYGLRAVWKNLPAEQPITGWAIACECAFPAQPILLLEQTFSQPNFLHTAIKILREREN